MDIDGCVVLTTIVVGCDDDNVATGDNDGTDCTDIDDIDVIGVESTVETTVAVFTDTVDIFAVTVTVCGSMRLLNEDAAEANADGFAPIS